MWAVVLCENIGNKKKMTRYGAGTGKRELEKRYGYMSFVQNKFKVSLFTHMKNSRAGLTNDRRQQTTREGWTCDPRHTIRV